MYIQKRSLLLAPIKHLCALPRLRRKLPRKAQDHPQATRPLQWPPFNVLHFSLTSEPDCMRSAPTRFLSPLSKEDWLLLTLQSFSPRPPCSAFLSHPRGPCLSWWPLTPAMLCHSTGSSPFTARVLQFTSIRLPVVIFCFLPPDW